MRENYVGRIYYFLKLDQRFFADPGGSLDLYKDPTDQTSDIAHTEPGDCAYFVF